jgi:hypothetical protein
MELTFSPATLAWNAISCDWILFLARMSLDYARYLADSGDVGDAQSYFKTAVYLGRYALRILADMTSTFIHELGHKLVAATHCDADCCMAAAQSKWLCRLRGLLGLPNGAYELELSIGEVGPLSEYDPDWRTLTATQCGSCSSDPGKGTADKPELCWIATNGVTRQDSIFISDACVGYDPSC